MEALLFQLLNSTSQQLQRRKRLPSLPDSHLFVSILSILIQEEKLTVGAQSRQIFTGKWGKEVCVDSLVISDNTFYLLLNDLGSLEQRSFLSFLLNHPDKGPAACLPGHGGLVFQWVIQNIDDCKETLHP